MQSHPEHFIYKAVIPTLAVLSPTLHALAEEALRSELKHPRTLHLVIAALDIDLKSRRLQSIVCFMIPSFICAVPGTREAVAGVDSVTSPAKANRFCTGERAGRPGMPWELG